jgi:flagellar assembly protein FliH
MSSFSHSFMASLAPEAPRYVAAAPVVTAAPFAVASQPTDPAEQFRPMVFLPFNGVGQIINEPEEPVVEILEDVEVVEAEEPPPPPPDFEALKASAWTEGFQVGYDEGIRLATEEQRDISTRLAALLHDVAADNEQLIRSLETQVVELALAVADKVIAREARVDREIVLNVARAALSEVHDATDLRIHAHPDDVALLEARWQEMLPRSMAEHSELVADDLVDRGGVVVETRIGFADSQLKTRLNQIVTAFQAVLDGEPA